MRKKILCFALVLCMLLGLCACGKTNTQETAAGTSTAQSGETSATGVAQLSYVTEEITLPDGMSSVSSICVNGTQAMVECYTQEGENALYLMQLEELTFTELAYTSTGGQDGYTSISALCAGQNGSFWILEQQSEYVYSGEGENQKITDTKLSYRLLNYSQDGTLTGEIALNRDIIPESTYISSFLSDEKGNLYLADWENVYVLNSEGTLLGTTAMEVGNDLCLYGDGQVVITGYDNGSFELLALNPDTLAWDKVADLPESAWTIHAGNDEYDLFYDTDGVVYGFHADTQTSEKVINWMDCDIDYSNVSSYTFLSDGRILAICYGDAGGLMLIHAVDASTLPEKTVLTLACMNLDWELRSQIVKFNRESSEYRIEVKDYSEYNSTEYSGSLENVTVTQTEDGLTKLNTELLSGNVPDILVTDGLPMQQYAAKGLLADLWEFIDADSELSRDSFVQGVLEADEVDGKLYEIPTSFSVYTAAALGTVVDGYSTWTLADLQDALASLGDGATVLNVDATQETVLSYCLYLNADSFIDWETKTCNFNSQEFIDYLNFAVSFPQKLDDNFNWDDYESDYVRILNGEQLMEMVDISGFDNIYETFAMLNNDIRFVGFPSTSGTDGSSFYLTSSLAISASSQNQEAAWSFIRFLLREETQEDSWYFPILKEAFEAKAAKAMEKTYETDENGNQVLDENGDPIELAQGGIGYDGGETIYLYAVTQEQYDAVMDLIQNTQKIMRYDTSLTDIISDETGAFFAGEKTAEETAQLIQNRAELYLAEQG